MNASTMKIRWAAFGAALLLADLFSTGPVRAAGYLGRRERH